MVFTRSEKNLVCADGFHSVGILTWDSTRMENQNGIEMCLLVCVVPAANNTYN